MNVAPWTAALTLAFGCASAEHVAPARAAVDVGVISVEPDTGASTDADSGDTARTWSIGEAIHEALAKHPRVAAANADKQAAGARVDAARFGYLPAVGVSGELNRSTSNNVAGTFFPAQGFPAISGTTTTKSLDQPSSWQSGVSLWASWDVLSIARQAAAVDVALAERHVADARMNAEQLDVAYRAGDAFLLLLEAEEGVRAARASVERADTLVQMTRPLVEQTLRPGVDLARAEAELATARTTLAQNELTRDARRTALAIATGHARLRVEIAPGNLLAPVDALGAPRRWNASSNPLVVEANAAAERASAAREVVRAEYLPRVDLVAALFARGSGVSTNATAEGVVPDTADWATGLVVTWSILDIPRIASRARAANADYAAAIARRDETVLTVSGELETASAYFEGAMRVARQTPLALAAARAAEQQARVRYQSSLAPLVDVADAERVLAQADAADAIARVEVRRALLLLARAAGNLDPFLARM